MARPDIANNAVRAVARYAYHPAETHRRAVGKIISYLSGTQKLGLVLLEGGELKLLVYVDNADYADKANDRRSVFGTTIMLGGTAVIGSSTTQHCVMFLRVPSTWSWCRAQS